MTPFLPKKDGTIECLKKCGFKTKDVFEWVEHANIEFAWSIRLDKRFSFDMFDFLYIMNELLKSGQYDEAYKHTQNAAILLINASNDELTSFVEEQIIRQEMPTLMEEVNDVLRREANE